MNHDYCYHNSAPKGSDNYYSLLKFDYTIKQKIAAIYCLFNTIFTIPFSVSDDAIAKTKLGWWQQELERSMQGNPTHPITQEFVFHKMDLGVYVLPSKSKMCI